MGFGNPEELRILKRNLGMLWVLKIDHSSKEAGMSSFRRSQYDLNGGVQSAMC